METIGTIHNLMNGLICDLGYELEFVHRGYIQQLIEIINKAILIRIPSADGTTDDGAILFIKGSVIFVAINNEHLPSLDSIEDTIKDIPENNYQNARVYVIKDEELGESLNLEFKYKNEFHKFKQYCYRGYFMTHCKGPGMDYLANVELVKIDKFDEKQLREFAEEVIDNGNHK